MDLILKVRSIGVLGKLLAKGILKLRKFGEGRIGQKWGCYFSGGRGVNITQNELPWRSYMASFLKCFKAEA